MGTTNTLDLNNRVTNLEKSVSGGDSAQANKTDIATEFNATTNYTAGCFVYHGGKLYQFNADHAAGAWDPTDAVEANVTDQVVSNAAAIAGLTASDVAYDNTASGLTATDVQGAVDEVKSGLTVRLPINVTLPATTDGRSSVQLDDVIPAGAKVVGYTINEVSTYSDAVCINAYFNSRTVRVTMVSNLDNLPQITCNLVVGITY